MVLTRNVRKLRTLGFAKWELLPNGRYVISVTPAGRAAYAQALQMHPLYALLQLEPGKLQLVLHTLRGVAGPYPLRHDSGNALRNGIRLRAPSA